MIVRSAMLIARCTANSIVINNQYAFVTNATNDNIAVIDYKKGKIKTHIPIKVDANIDQYRGLLPFGIDISKDNKYLYVALLGFNAVAKIDIASKKTIGLIPTGWGTKKTGVQKHH